MSLSNTNYRLGFSMSQTGFVALSVVLLSLLTSTKAFDDDDSWLIGDYIPASAFDSNEILEDFISKRAHIESQAQSEFD